jgi:hypothetical protein
MFEEDTLPFTLGVQPEDRRGEPSPGSGAASTRSRGTAPFAKANGPCCVARATSKIVYSTKNKAGYENLPRPGVPHGLSRQGYTFANVNLDCVEMPILFAASSGSLATRGESANNPNRCWCHVRAHLPEAEGNSRLTDAGASSVGMSCRRIRRCTGARLTQQSTSHAVYVSPAWYWIVKYHAGRTTEPHFSAENGGKAPCFSLRLGALAVGEARGAHSRNDAGRVLSAC